MKTLNTILVEPIDQYLNAKINPFTGNLIAKKFRANFPQLLSNVIPNSTRYRCIGSAGKGGWSDNPWIAILDLLVTKTPESGFYPVILFRADMSGAYLSLNQGVTKLNEGYKGRRATVLMARAKDYRARININKDYLQDINLLSKTSRARLYEAGNIVAKYYPASLLPSSEQLSADVLEMLRVYNELVFCEPQLDDESDLEVQESKKYKLHMRVERNSSISKKIKKSRGFVCEVCNFTFREKYGRIGENFIEVHHLVPISTLQLGTFKLNAREDFALLCSNCHRMIHKLEDPSDIDGLKKIIGQHSKI